MGWPEHLTAYKLLTDWGSVFGGLITLVAGVLAYWAGRQQAIATQRAADDQLGAAKQKDCLRARGIAYGIYPELLEMEISCNKANRYLANGLSPDTMESAQAFNEVMQITIPPVMERNIDNFYLLGPGGEYLIRLFSVSAQYNRLLGLIEKDTKLFDFDSLQSHLDLIASSLGNALREVAKIHDAH